MSTVSAPSPNLGIQDYGYLWAASAGQVLEQIAGTPFHAQDRKDGEVQTLAETAVYARFSVNQPLAGEQALAVSAPDGLRLAQLLLGEALDENAAFDADHRDTVAKIFRQIAGAAAVSLGGKLGSEIEVKFVDTERPAWLQSEPASLQFQLSSSQAPPILLHLCLNQELVKCVAALSSAPKTPADASETTPAEAGNETRRGTKMPDRSQHEPNIDLLKDVQLSATLRFGERQVLLRDVLELTPGAVVELDQQITEPVELLVGGKVMARGEVVVVDGNYGLRVTEIISPAERIESLRI